MSIDKATSLEIFGPLFSPHVLEEATVAHLEGWLPTYTEAVEAQYDLELPEVVTWGLVDSFDRWDDSGQGLPALVVGAEGIGNGGEPEKYGGGDYRAGWELHVLLVVEHPKPDAARKIAQLYSAAIRGLMLQQGTLDGAVSVTDWLDEGYPYSIGESSTRAAAENSFLVEKDEVVNWQRGPKTPTPPKPLPEVKEVDVKTEIEK